MIGECKTCKKYTEVIITRKRKLKSGDFVRDYHCKPCHLIMKAGYKRNRVTLTDKNWNNHAQGVIYKLSKKYGSEYGQYK